MKRQESRFEPFRRGSVFCEALVAIVLATSVVLGASQLLLLASNQSRVAEQRTLAVHEVGNLMEDVMSRPWSELSTSSSLPLQLSPVGQQRLSNSQVKVEVGSEGEDSRSRRISIQIEWRCGAGRNFESVRLVAWRSRDSEAKP